MSADFIGLDPDVDYEREYELKLHEMEQLKHSYDEYVESSREYERELETQLRQSDARHQELEKKIQVSELKYRSLQDNYDRICRDFTSTITNLQALQNSMVIIEDNNRKLENENEQLINHVRVLQTTEQDLIHKMNAYQEEIIFLKNDVEQLQENKINIENSLKNEILTLKEDVKRGLNHRRRKSHLNKPDFGMDSLDFNTQESELLAQTQENLELTVRELATVISELEAENADLQGQLFQAKKRLANGVVDRSLSLDPTDEVVLLKEEIEGLREVIAQKDTELAHFAHLQEVIEEKDERLRLIEKEFMEMLTPTFKAAKADTFYRMVPSSVGQNGSHLQIDSTTSVMGRLKSFLGTDDAEKLKKELIKMVGKYESERSRSVQLLHKIQTLQGNIIACCRTRPPSDQELAAGGKIIVDTMDDTELMFYDSRVDTWKSFAFDRVWKADKNQVDVFADVEPVIISVAEGYNACIMAYGQTGSGKTYTMDGYGDQYGLSYRTIQKLFETLETKKSNKNGSNKNLLALTTKSPRETPRTHHKKEFNGIGKSSSSHGATFEYVNPMISLSAPTGSASRRSSRATSASPADRYPAAFSPATASLNDSSSHEPLDVGIAGMSESVGGSVVGSGVNGSDSLDFSDRGDGIELVSDVEDDDDDEYDESHYSYTVEISMLEIYNEQVYDLLHDQYGGGQSDGVSLDLRTTPDNLVIVPGLRQYKVHDMDEVDTVFSRGAKNRATSSTNLNNQSSRSHLITIVEVTVEENEGTSSTGRLFLVDLAGSERINKSGAKGQVLKEAQYINKSLSALGDVMEALDSKQRHIPFRNSKLTYLLQNALGGNSKTMMIFTVCPTDLTSDETLFTLQFAQRVRNITLTTAHRNITAKNLEISVKMLKSELRDMKKKKLALEELLIENKKDNKKLLDKISAPLESKIRLLEEQKRSYEFNITNLQRQIQDINHKVDEEKTQRQQTLFDLELTQRNLKRALEVSKEYTIENDRLSSLLKNKENELESLKEAVTKTILTAPPPPPPPQQHQPLAQKRSPSSHNSPVSAAGSMTNGASIGSPRVNTTSTPSVVTPKPTPIVLYPRELDERVEEREKEEVVRKGEEDKPETETDHHRETEVYDTPQQNKNHQREEEEELDDRYVTPSHSIYEKTPLNTPLPQVSPLSMSDTPVTLNSSSLTPLSKRLSPMAPGKLMPAHLVTTSSVTSLLGELQVEDAVRGREVAAEGGVSGGRGRESVIAGVTPNLTHRKIYQRKDPVPRQHHSASPTVGRLKRTDSHNSMGSMTSTPTSVHSTTSRSPSTSSSVTMRSQEALKKHQQRMEQKSLASLYKGKIY